jgi:prepilin-type N-terminal cleavage/methylation domain-containing protein
VRTAGFTLVELTVVLLILAIAAGAVVLRVEGPLRRAEMEDVMDRIARFDGNSRVLARRHDRPLRLAVNLATGELSRRSVEDGSECGPPLELPEGYRLARLLIRDREIGVGEASVSINGSALSPTYAVLVEGPNRSLWLLVCGLTGQVVRSDDEKEIRDILEATFLRRDAG